MKPKDFHDIVPMSLHAYADVFDINLWQLKALPILFIVIILFGHGDNRFRSAYLFFLYTFISFIYLLLFIIIIYLILYLKKDKILFNILFKNI
jgi:NADH:ubiquinone oxidoreductase subunit 4 (subunit M)